MRKAPGFCAVQPRGQRHRGVVETIEKADGTRHRHHQSRKSQDVRVDDCGLLDHATSVGELRDLAATLNLSTDELRGGLLGCCQARPATYAGSRFHVWTTFQKASARIPNARPNPLGFVRSVGPCQNHKVLELRRGRPTLRL